MNNKIKQLGKKFVLALAAASGISTPAVAFDASKLLPPEEVEYQSALLDAGVESVDESANDDHRDPRDRRPGRVRDRDRDRDWDRDRGDRDRDWDRDRDRDRDRRPWPPRRPYPPRRDRVSYVYQCYARNGRGQTFVGQDRWDARYAQREAMRECYRYSRRCVELGCRQVRRWD